MDSKSLSAKQFQEILSKIESMKNESVVTVEVIDYVLSSGYKLLMEFQIRTESRAKWRLRAETAEAKLR